jgi:hypothetical protein
LNKIMPLLSFRGLLEDFCRKYIIL